MSYIFPFITLPWIIPKRPRVISGIYQKAQILLNYPENGYIYRDEPKGAMHLLAQIAPRAGLTAAPVLFKAAHCSVLDYTKMGIDCMAGAVSKAGITGTQSVFI